MFIKAPPIHKGSSSSLCREQKSGSKVPVVLKTAQKSYRDPFWWYEGGRCSRQRVVL